MPPEEVPKVTVEDLRRFAALVTDLDDPEVMAKAWDQPTTKEDDEDDEDRGMKIPSSGRQRRKLAWHLGFKKCPVCREKTISIVKGQVTCLTCGTAIKEWE